ncbi:hypothetical protein [Bowmanella sp. JS7-9]|uniref:Porin n=1 Tax=Pseudobowmanella zhangzhouensis TaxID=1537679 RepID=A0ABW1XND7_9ALTE|nr:hypothetical protein [Bowmanella sp. JS7-9]
MKKSIIATALASVLAFSAQADINFSGFATVVGGKTSGDDQVFRGYDNEFDLSTGSLFAIQANSDLGDGLSATVQMMARGSDDWDPEFAWAYLSYDATEDWRLLFGRQRAPMYLYSDYLDVSYAYHWLRPPQAVYDAPFDTFDGIGSIYSTTVGDSFVTWHMIYGINDDKDTPINDTTLDTKFSDLFGGSLTWNYDWLTLRGAYFQANAYIPLNEAPAGTAVSQIAALQAGWATTPYAVIADEIGIDDDKITFAEFGMQIDYNDWVIVGEITKLDLSKTIFPDQDSWYVSVGKRMDSVMLHATYGNNKDSSEFLVPKYNVPFPTGTALDALAGGTQLVQNTLDVDEDFYTLGIRWDFHPSVAFKAEFTNTEDDVLGKDVKLFQIGLVSVF